MMTGVLYFGTKEAYGFSSYEPPKPKLFSLTYLEDGRVDFLSCNEGIPREDLEEVLEAVLKHLKGEGY